MEDEHREITKIAREANKLVLGMMKESGIGSGEFDLLHLVRHEPGISQKEIAEKLNMDKGAVARRVSNLEKKGYLRRCDDPHDGRSQQIFANEQAEALKCSKAMVEAVFYDWLLEGLPQEERAEFLRLLDVLYRRSKAESRAGFPTVHQRLEAEE